MGRPKKVNVVLDSVIDGKEVEQLKFRLEDTFKIPKEQLVDKTLKELDELYTFLTSEINKSDEIVATQKVPHYYAPEWHDYVMGQFVPEELDDKGNPKVDGLRRVTEFLLGEIVGSYPVNVSSSPELASVSWQLQISWRCGCDYIDIDKPEPYPIRTFGAFVDACPQNCKAPYSKFLASIADTRAESKSLRRALRLHCIAAEEAELGETNTFEKTSDGSYNENEPANDQQKMLIRVISERNKIDFTKLITKEFSTKTIDLLNKTEASFIIAQLNKYQSSVKNQSEEIPEEIKV